MDSSTDEAIEEWRDVPGWEGSYRVSSLGRVFSVPRKWAGARFLKPGLDSDGYPKVGLARDNKIHTRTVHKLVAEAFLGPRPEGLQIRHLDGDKLRPHVDNLAYGTGSENQLDTVRFGMNPNANKTRCLRNHEYTEANTYRNPKTGYRYCRKCHAANAAAWRLSHIGTPEKK